MGCRALQVLVIVSALVVVAINAVLRYLLKGALALVVLFRAPAMPTLCRVCPSHLTLRAPRHAVCGVEI